MIIVILLIGFRLFDSMLIRTCDSDNKRKTKKTDTRKKIEGRIDVYIDSCVCECQWYSDSFIYSYIVYTIEYYLVRSIAIWTDNKA